MRPHPNHLHHPLCLEHLVNQPMLDIDPPRIGSGKITDELLVGRRIREWILRKDRKQELRFGLQAC